MISRKTIDTVFETARVEEVIGDFVQLKRAGSNYKGLSPFTDERTPSFMVSPSKQIWKDFSSGKGGNAVSFLMEHEHFSYPEAIRFLAKKYGIEIEETEQTSEQKIEADERESLYLISDFAKEYFHQTLLDTEEGKAIGLSYFKERGFTDETIKKFDLGYALNDWNAFTRHALDKGYLLDLLEKTGLTIIKEGADNTAEKTLDRFRGRVMFPIKSMSGRTLGFGGRILTTDKKVAKYLNSPESIIYYKSKVLYGLFEAKQAIAKEDNCFLVEGYTDVIQMYQKGVENVVSSSGTALTSDQIRLINRLTANITVLFDGDAAGLRAAIRGVDLILEQGMNVKIVTFPEGEDPDSFSRRNSTEDLKNYLEQNAVDFISFKANLLAEDSAKDPIKKAETIHEIILSISKIPDLIKREVYVRECSRIMDVSEQVLFNTLAQLLQKSHREGRKKTENVPFEVITPEKEKVEKVDVQKELENEIKRLLVLHGHRKEEFVEWVTSEKSDKAYEVEYQELRVFEKIYLELQDDETHFASPEFRNIFHELINQFVQNPNVQAASFVNDLPPEIAGEVSGILMDEERLYMHDWQRKDIFVKDKNQNIGALVMETLVSLRWHLLSKQIAKLSLEVQNEKDDDDNIEILQEVSGLWGLKQLCAEKLGRVI
ncbi:MAG TPA: DNA primase [Flavobacteriaceae bacterium]|nr:DNA primase [Flavobacteriaceae bacterium]